MDLGASRAQKVVQRVPFVMRLSQVELCSRIAIQIVPPRLVSSSRRNLQKSESEKRANATTIKLTIDSCTHNFSFFALVGRVTYYRVFMFLPHLHASII